MPLSSNDSKPSVASMNDFTQSITERNRQAIKESEQNQTNSNNDNNNQNTNEASTTTTEEEVESTVLQKWQDLTPMTQYSMIAGGVTLAVSFFILSFWVRLKFYPFCIFFVS